MTGQKNPDAFHGKIIILACLLIQGIGVGGYIAYGVFFKSLLDEFGWSRTTVSGASAMAFLLMGFLGILVGNLNDKYGPRAIMTVTGIFLGCGYLLMSQLQSAWQLYLFFGLVAGIGLSSIDVIPLTTAARWFPLRRGTMSGVVKAGTGAGQLVMPLIAGLCITQIGWRHSFIVMGLISLFFIIGAGLLLRRDPGYKKPLHRDRTKMPVETILSTESGLSFKEAVRSRQLWTLCAVFLLSIFCMLTVMIHIVPHATDIGIDTVKAAGILSTIGGISVLGRLSVGIAIDRIGAIKCLAFCLALLIICFLWLNIAREMWMLYMFAAIYGVAHGGIFTVMSPIAAELFGIRSHGVIFGIVAFSGTVGGSLGPILAGIVFDVTRSYVLFFLLLAALASVALVLTRFLKPTTLKAPHPAST